MNDTRNIAIDVLDNLEYRLGVFDDILRSYGDDAELDADELEQITEYAKIHGIEGRNGYKRLG